ncbi:MAG: hypothetical protein JRI23_25740 [Deltaproteobacteria bacterium]|jgi:hypothetical protein|nr:hypothetical protein [Deltaproteobacteria bacterium]MBW2535430.1 hypothetical protein [Deltaproteobacteria bacterium]
MNHFHDTAGWLIVGLDQHFGIHFPTPIPRPMFFWELVFLHPYSMGSSQAGTVQLNGGHNAATDQYTSPLLWAHFPVAPDPLNMLVPLDILFGKHKTWLPRTAVLIEGKPGAITVSKGAASIDMDCWVGSTLPSSLSLQPGTVVTDASWADFVVAAHRLAVEVAMYVVSKAKVVKGRYPNRPPPAAPSAYSWRNVLKNGSYMLRRDVAGRRARATFRNTLAREFVSRTLPFKIDRSGGRVSLQRLPGNKCLEWAAKGLGVDPDSIVRNVAMGKPPISTDLASYVDRVKGMVPGYRGVAGLAEAQGDGQLDFNPFG